LVDQGTNGMVLESSVQCGGMQTSRDQRLALLLSFVMALLSAVPYVIASGVAPDGTLFNGFLINPIDGFSYLAKMRQGFEGNWTLVLPYAPEPGPRALLYIYYVLLGHFSHFFSLDLIVTFHIGRILGATLAFYCGYLLIDHMISYPPVRWFAFGLILIGSGLGWLSLFFTNLVSSDILIPESIPFLVAYGNAHFPLALAALLAVVLMALGNTWKVWTRVIVAGISGCIIGAILPFSLISLLVTLGIWCALEVWVYWRDPSSQVDRRTFLHAGTALVASFVGALPWLIYDYWLSRSHPVISAWNLQNQTPSPNPSAYLLGFALLIFLSAFGILRERPWRTGKGRLILVWILTGALLLYAPLAFQRRLSLGLAVPLSILAAWGWESISMRADLRKPLAILVITLLSLSNLLVMIAGISGVIQGESAVVFEEHELDSYRWIEENIPRDSLILAGEQTGNRLPAFAAVRVLYGHPFETPDADGQVVLVAGFFQDEDADIASLRELGITWVYLGENERQLGQPAWLEVLELRWQEGEIAIYEVPPA
jgi:hypothetical protein